MKIKECYISQNGISCFTNINSLINIKDIKLKNHITSTINKSNIFFYIALRLTEFIINDFVKNKNYLNNYNTEDSLLLSIIYS